MEESNPPFETVMSCVFGIEDHETRAYLALLCDRPGCTVEELATTLERDRSTVNRSLSTLHERGLVRRDRRLLGRWRPHLPVHRYRAAGGKGAVARSAGRLDGHGSRRDRRVRRPGRVSRPTAESTHFFPPPPSRPTMSLSLSADQPEQPADADDGVWLECIECGDTFAPFDDVRYTCDECDGLLEVRYADLPAFDDFEGGASGAMPTRCRSNRASPFRKGRRRCTRSLGSRTISASRPCGSNTRG